MWLRKTHSIRWVDVSSSSGTYFIPPRVLSISYQSPYSSIVIEGGIFISHGIWLIRTRKLRAAAKASGRSFDDLPESEPYHVDVPRKGSIAASRDTEHVEIERRGSIAVARERDLEAGQRKSIAKEVIVEETGSTKSGNGAVNATEQEVRRSLEGQGAQESAYGTMEQRKKEGPRTRPVFERQDTSDSAFFKDLVW